MFGFGKKIEATPRQNMPEEDNKPGLFRRLKIGLTCTRENFTDGLSNLLLGHKQINDELLEDLETLLISADVGVDVTRRIIDDLTRQVQRKALSDPQILSEMLKRQLAEILHKGDAPVRQAYPENIPYAAVVQHGIGRPPRRRGIVAGGDGDKPACDAAVL